MRLSEDRGAGAAQTPPFLLAALAVLPEEAHTGDSVQNARRGLGPAVGLVAGSIPLSQQAWQVLLLGWSESTAPSGAAADKPKLIAQPIRFPIGAVCGCDAALGYTYRNAALVDVHLAVDEARGVAVVTTCWRAEAGCDASSERVLFEGLVGRTEVPLQELRAQDYTPPGPTGAGPTRLAELVAPGQMALSRHGAEHDRLRLRSEDEIFFRQLEDSVLSMSQSASAEVERAVQVTHRFLSGRN